MIESNVVVVRGWRRGERPGVALGACAVAVALALVGEPCAARAQECPDFAPLYCASEDGCCPYGDGGRTDVCCPDRTCTRNGMCGSDPGPGPGPMCPGSAPLYCASSDGCCPYGDGGRTDVCCDDGTCTRNGSCGGPGPGPGPMCPGSAPLYCASTDGCCPYGSGGRTDVCCDDGTCTTNGVCGGGPPPRGGGGGGSSRSGGGCSVARSEPASGALSVIALVGLTILVARRRTAGGLRAPSLVLAACASLVGCSNGSGVSTAALANGCTEVRRHGEVTVVCDHAELETILSADPEAPVPRVLAERPLAPRTLAPAVRPIGRADEAAGAREGIAPGTPQRPASTGRDVAAGH